MGGDLGNARQTTLERWFVSHAAEVTMSRMDHIPPTARRVRHMLVSQNEWGPEMHQQIDQVLWHWTRVLDGRSRFGTRCGTVPLWGPSGCWGAGAGIRKLPTLDNGLRNFDATLRSNPPAPPGTSYSRAQRSSFQNAGTPTPPFRVVPSRPQVLTILEARSVCASCFTRRV